MVQVVSGKCAHCQHSGKHTLDRRHLLGRNVYTCKNCTHKTARCRLCSGMAMVGPTWADELCDDHAVAGGSWEEGELDCIANWAELWKDDMGWMKRALFAISPYRGDAVESFDILRHTAPSDGPRVVFVNGFLGQSDDQFVDWSPSADRLFGGLTRYGLRWESKRGGNTGELATLIGSEAVLALKSYGLSVLWGWLHTARKAEDTGRMLANVLIRAPQQKFILCGHSLGARVIFSALTELANRKRTDVVETAHLMGGAVGVDGRRDWEKAMSACSGGIANYWSDKDDVLKWLYKPAMGFMSEPIGRNPIPNARNVDLSNKVMGHNGYKKWFGEVASYPLGLRFGESREGIRLEY